MRLKTWFSIFNIYYEDSGRKKQFNVDFRETLWWKSNIYISSFDEENVLYPVSNAYRYNALIC